MAQSKPKIAIFQSFFKCKGGAEKLIFQIRNYYGADLYTPVIHRGEFNPEKPDQFTAQLYDPNYKLFSVGGDLEVPVIRLVWRQICGIYLALHLRFVARPDIVISTGNLFGVQRLLGNKIKKINFCHTPPRIFTDQKKVWLRRFPDFTRPIFSLIADILLRIYAWDIKSSQTIVTNSENIKNRLKKYTGADSTAIFSPAQTDRFKYISTGDYYITFGRLEEIKRIKLIVAAFGQMPDKKLVICSSGPLKSWVENEIKNKKYTNIEYLGLVSDSQLDELVGNCLTGIYIPEDEDAGMIQIELMSAGKPPVGVAEGGLLETIEDGKSGYLLPVNPKIEDLINLVKTLSAEEIKSKKEAARNRALQFSTSVFFEKLDKVVDELSS